MLPSCLSRVSCSVVHRTVAVFSGTCNLQAFGRQGCSPIRDFRCRSFHSSARLSRDGAGAKGSGTGSTGSTGSGAPRDYYEVLGVPRTATQAEIKKAFHTMARKLHPDAKPGDAAAAEKFKEASAAYEVLGDEKKRAAYDQFGAAGVDGSGGGPGPGGFGGGAGFAGFEEMMRQFGFGADGWSAMFTEGGPGGGGGGGFTVHTNMGGGMGMGAERGPDLEAVLRLRFDDAVRGCEKEVRFSARAVCAKCSGSGAKPGTQPVKCARCGGTGHERAPRGGVFIAGCRECRGAGEIIREPCGACQGSGTSLQPKTVSVKVPAGVASGNSIRLAGQGHQLDKQQQPGHLYLRLQVDDDPVFRREHEHVHVDVPLTVGQAALGGKVRVPPLPDQASEQPLEVTVPSGTQSGDTVVLAGKGIRRVGSSGRGNQIVHFNVVIPRNLTPRQKQLLEEFSKDQDLSTESKWKTFFGRLKSAFGSSS